MQLIPVNLDGVEMHTETGDVIRFRRTGADRSSEFFVNVDVGEAMGLARGEVPADLRDRARRVLEHWRTPDPEIVEAVKRLPWWKDVKVEAETPGAHILVGTLVADPSVYFLAGNEEFEMCRPPCPDEPWVVCLYHADGDDLGYNGKATSIPELVSILDGLTRSFLEGTVHQEDAT